MGPDAISFDADEFVDALIEVNRAMSELAGHMEKLGDSCGPTREDHDVAYCVLCEGGYCRQCGRADAWHTRCAHEPAWPHDQ